MFRLNKDQKRLPFGGHHFYESGLMLRGENLGEVAEKLADYRLNNNRTVGNPEQDILRYYSVNFPWMVKEDDERPPVEDANYKAWRSWIQKTWIKPPQKVITRKEASYRWDICKACPHNVNLNLGNPTPEIDQLSRKAFLIRRGSTIPSDLSYCDLHRADLGVLSFIETPKDHSEKLKDSPDYQGCWV